MVTVAGADKEILAVVAPAGIVTDSGTSPSSVR